METSETKGFLSKQVTHSTGVMVLLILGSFALGYMFKMIWDKGKL